jgi:hypothetical protein
VTSEEVRDGSPELSMIMLIDTLGERYGKLPSEVIRQATTFDIFVADTAIAYRNAQMEKAYGRDSNKDPGQYSEDDLIKVLKESRGES